MSQGIMFFDSNMQALEHVLSNILKLQPQFLEKAKNWLTYNGISSMQGLLRLFTKDLVRFNTAEYKAAGRKETLYLGRLTIVSMGILCKMALAWKEECKISMTNGDWLKVTRQDYDNFQYSLHKPHNGMLPTAIPSGNQVPSRPPVGIPTNTAQVVQCPPKLNTEVHLDKTVRHDNTRVPLDTTTKKSFPMGSMFHSSTAAATRSCFDPVTL
jgi:hypothetical protein